MNASAPATGTGQRRRRSLALAGLGCELAQGHYVAPPMAASEATRWLWEHRAGAETPQWPDRFTISATHHR